MQSRHAVNLVGLLLRYDAHILVVLGYKLRTPIQPGLLFQLLLYCFAINFCILGSCVHIDFVEGPIPNVLDELLGLSHKIGITLAV